MHYIWRLLRGASNIFANQVFLEIPLPLFRYIIEEISKQPIESRETEMAFELNKSDYELLAIIAEYRVLTVNQVALLAKCGKQKIYRWLRCFEKEGLVRVAKQDFGQNVGRPQTLIDLTESGVDILRDRGLLSHNISYERVHAQKIHCLGHQLLMNWFRVYLNQAEKVLPTVGIKFLSHNSPFLSEDAAGHTFVTAHAPIEGSNGEVVKFIPDGVFSLTDSTQELTILFFLEVDCGTETLASPRREMVDIRQKIINYQSYFLSERYKRYENIWNCKLAGFRLLFLTNTLGRLASLCRLAQEMGPEDTRFVWLTDQSRLVAGGVTNRIWAKAGALNLPQKSIFGSLCRSAALPK